VRSKYIPLDLNEKTHSKKNAVEAGWPCRLFLQIELEIRKIKIERFEKKKPNLCGIGLLSFVCLSKNELTF
jgi:hypothetical protein